jgi:polygalacturonase
VQNNLLSYSEGAMRGHLRAGLFITLFLFSCGLRNASAASRHSTPRVCTVRQYGATGDGITLDTAAINRAITDCHARGGGVVEVTPGTYISGTIYFQDNIDLDVQEGATILASSNLADYPHMSHASEWRDTSLLVAENVSNIALTGKGTIDGNGRAFISPNQVRWTPSFDIGLTRQGQAWSDRMALSNEGPLTMSLRPGVLFVALHVNGLKIKDIHVVDSPNWTIKVGCSRQIMVDGLDVRNDLLIPNNDALDISTSSDATVQNSYLQAGDDALVIGGPCLDGWCQGPTEHIRVNNVTLVSRSAAIRVGPSAKGVHDVKVSHVVIRDSNRGILIHTRTSETLEDIEFSDITINTRLIDGPWWGAGEPISIGVALSDYVSWPKVTTLGFVRHVRFSHIVTNSDSPMVFYSMEPGHIQDIGFDHLSVNMVPDALNTVLGGNLDLQPTSPVNFGVQKRDLPAILVHNVDGLKLNNVKVRWTAPFPSFYTNAVSADGFTDLSIDGFEGAASAPDLPAIALHTGSGASIKHARSTAGKLLEETDVK